MKPGSGFARAGVQLRDVIVRIEGNPTLDLTAQQALATLQACAQKGSVQLEVAAGDEVDRVLRNLGGPYAAAFVSSIAERRLGAKMTPGDTP